MQFRVIKILFGIVEVALGIWLIFGLKEKFDAKSLTTTSTLIFWPAIALVVLGTSSLLEFLMNKKLQVLKVNILIFFVLIFIGEIALRYLMFYSTYFEKNNQEPYVSVYEEPTFDSIGFHRPSNSKFNYHNGEFEYQRTCNNWGYTNRDLPALKPKNEIWFFVFGDSFCEGAGVPFNSAVPAQLEAHFRNYDSTLSIKFYNFGMAGSDVVFQYFLFQNHLNSKNPDGIIFLQNTTDVNDIKIRGGEDRFQDNYQLKYRDAPRWEWIYASSHFLRAFFHRIFGYDFSLFHESEQLELEKNAVELINNTLINAKDKNENVFVFTFPQLEEFKKTKYTFQYFCNWAKNTSWVTDLSEPFFELSAGGTDVNTLYWPMDRHFNEKGYSILSNLIAKELEPNINKIIENKKKSLTLELQTSN